MSKLETYGLSKLDLELVKKKIIKQKKYLESQTFLTEHGEEKNLLDVSYSANLSERYYPRILNKVDTFVTTSISLGLVPVFLTVTADGFFRRMLKGDYSEWTEELKTKYQRHIPNNKRSGNYFDYMNKHSKLTPKDVYKILGHQLHRFYKDELFRDIKKQGYKYTSIRVTEPHKDGVPHFHILMYIPPQFTERLYKLFLRSFPAPQNHKKLTYKNTRGSSRRNGQFICNMIQSVDGVRTTVPMYETKGFQVVIKNASGYILKYILKSFRNLIENKDIDYLQAWYIHNKIPRLITTHTLVSQDIYHKSSLLDNDWHYLTDLKIEGKLKIDRLNNYFRFDDGRGRVILHDNGYYILTNNGRIIQTYGQKNNIIPKVRLRSCTFTTTKPKDFSILDRYEIYTPFKEYKYWIRESYKDGVSFAFTSLDDFCINEDIQYISNLEPDYLSIVQTDDSKFAMTDSQLYTAYNNFDFDTHSPIRWASLHNEMVNRGLIHDRLVSLNDYNQGVLNDW